MGTSHKNPMPIIVKGVYGSRAQRTSVFTAPRHAYVDFLSSFSALSVTIEGRVGAILSLLDNVMSFKCRLFVMNDVCVCDCVLGILGILCIATKFRYKKWKYIQHKGWLASISCVECWPDSPAIQFGESRPVFFVP